MPQLITQETETEKQPGYVSPQPKTATTQTTTEATVTPPVATAKPKSRRRGYRRMLRKFLPRIRAREQRYYLFGRTRSKRVSLLIGGIFLLLLGMGFGTLLQAVVEWWNSPINKEAETLLVRIAPQLVLGVIGLVGGIIGLLQWNRNYAQKQEEIRLKEIELQKRTAEFEAKQELDILNAEKELPRFW